MDMDVVIESMSCEIKRILTEFGETRNEVGLSAQGATHMTRVLSNALRAAGQAGLRTFLESHEESSETVDLHGQRYRYKFDSTKLFHTSFGVMELSRRLYQPDQGGESFVPLDAAWGMEGEYATPEVREACLFGLGLNTSEEVEAMLKKCALFHPSASTIKRMATDMKAWLEEHKDTVDAAIREQEPVPAEVDILVGSLDGVNVLLAEPGKKKGRPTERPKQKQDDEKTSYRNAMVGSVSLYTCDTNEEGELIPVRLRSRYVARMPEDYAPTVKGEWEQELSHASSRLSEEAHKLLVLDGSRALWKYVENHDGFESYEKAVDFFHTTEHLSSAAEALFGKKSEEGTKWYHQYRTKLLDDDQGAESVIRSMDYYRLRTKLPQARQEQLDRERTFFRRNKARMPYASWLARGRPIGSGVVEAACKSVVKQRLCRSGMRWSRPGGQAILNLRTYIKSSRWDPFWEHYNKLRQAS